MRIILISLLLLSGTLVFAEESTEQKNVEVTFQPGTTADADSIIETATAFVDALNAHIRKERNLSRGALQFVPDEERWHMQAKLLKHDRVLTIENIFVATGAWRIKGERVKDLLLARIQTRPTEGGDRIWFMMLQHEDKWLVVHEYLPDPFGNSPPPLPMNLTDAEIQQRMEEYRKKREIKAKADIKIAPLHKLIPPWKKEFYAGMDEIQRQKAAPFKAMKECKRDYEEKIINARKKLIDQLSKIESAEISEAIQEIKALRGPRTGGEKELKYEFESKDANDAVAAYNQFIVELNAKTIPEMRKLVSEIQNIINTINTQMLEKLLEEKKALIQEGKMEEALEIDRTIGKYFRPR